MSEHDPQIREWFVNTSPPKAAAEFSDSVMRRIRALQRERFAAAIAAASMLLLGGWMCRSLLANLYAEIGAMTANIGELMTSPLTLAMTVLIVAAGWSVARCRGWDV